MMPNDSPCILQNCSYLNFTNKSFEFVIPSARIHFTKSHHVVQSTVAETFWIVFVHLVDLLNDFEMLLNYCFDLGTI